MLQVAEKLRTDPRVVVIDRTNLRYLQLKDLPGDAAPVDLVSLDLSFISVLKVMPVVCELLRPGGVLIVLVKPQFEANRDQVRPVRALLAQVCVIASMLMLETEGCWNRGHVCPECQEEGRSHAMHATPSMTIYKYI